MNLTTIATALNGRFVPIGDHHGFIESSLSIPRDGTLLGAYLFDCGNGQLRITDDGDTLFNVAAAGAIVGLGRPGLLGQSGGHPVVETNGPDPDWFNPGHYSPFYPQSPVPR